jgi:CRP-like cAMP-binding protein
LLQEWLTGLGRRAARARTAHLICEISTRMGAAGRGQDAFDFPLSQIELADLLGLSAVHVNRVLQQLRAERLVDFARGRLAILNRPRLIAIAGFDASYLGETK